MWVVVVAAVVESTPTAPPLPPAHPCGGAFPVHIDFSSVTNPAVGMEWLDANGTLYTATPSGAISGSIPALATDTTGGAFPGGSVRWTNLGYDDGVAFDMVVTVSQTPTYYADFVDVEYWNPVSSSTTQAVYTTGGFACIGFGLRPATCASGAALDATNATCVDGTTTIFRAAEFDFTFVRAGTDTQMPPFGRMYTTFFDVDGDVAHGGSVYEFVSVLGASRAILAASSTLLPGVFEPSGANAALAQQNVNVQTDFAADPQTPSAVSLPAIAAFEVFSSSSIKVLLGGRSSSPYENPRGYCFAMSEPDIGVGCSPSPPATPPPLVAPSVPPFAPPAPCSPPLSPSPSSPPPPTSPPPARPPSPRLPPPAAPSPTAPPSPSSPPPSPRAPPNGPPVAPPPRPPAPLAPPASPLPSAPPPPPLVTAPAQPPHLKPPARLPRPNLRRDIVNHRNVPAPLARQPPRLHRRRQP